MGMQAEYNDVKIDNGTWRKLTGSVGKSISFDGTMYVTIEFTIEGSTPDELQQRLKTTEDALLKANRRFTVSLDDSVGTYYVDMTPYDGRFLNVKPKLDVSPFHEQTGHSLYMLFTATSELVFGEDDDDDNPFAPPFVGALNDINFAETFTAGRVNARTIDGTFVPTFDGAAYGPFSISSVSNSGGKALFTLVGTLPTYTVGMKISVSGSTSHDGDHVVTSISGQDVLTTRDFTGTDTGTGVIGERTSGEDNYLAARDELLTTLGVGTNGARDATTGLSLTLETRNAVTDNKDALQISLVAEYQPFAFTNTPSLRQSAINIERLDPDRWEEEAGTPPVYLQVVGFVDLDKNVLTTSLINAWDTQVRPDIEAIVKAEYNKSELKPLKISVTPEYKENRINFNALFQADNTTLIAYTKAISWNLTANYVRHGDSAGYHLAQRPPYPDFLTVSKVVTRIGLGPDDLDSAVELNDFDFSLLPGGKAGFTFVTQSEGGGSRGPLNTEFGSNTYETSRSRTYERLKFKGSKDITTVLTQGGK